MKQISVSQFSLLVKYIYFILCHSKNLIYAIACNGCNLLYIGETGTTLRARIRVLKQQIRDPEYRKIKLSKHIYVCGRGQFKVFPFYKLFTQRATERRKKEKRFIQTLPKISISIVLPKIFTHSKLHLYITKASFYATCIHDYRWLLQMSMYDLCRNS